MSDLLTTNAPPSRRTIGTPMSWAIVALLALFAIAAALIVAGVNPAMDGQVIAALAGLLILVMAAVVTIALPVLDSLGRTASNDEWVYW